MSFTVEKANEWDFSRSKDNSLLESLGEESTEALEKSGLESQSQGEIKDVNTIIEKQEDKSILETEKKEEKKEGEPEVLPETFSNILTELAESGVLNLYEDYDIKTVDDFKGLIQDNIQDRLTEVNQNIFQETLQSLPPQFQSVMKYGLSGGSDVTSLLDAWANVEKTYNADVSTDTGKEQVVRDFLKLSNYGTDEMIEQDIKTWKDLGTLDTKVELYKPKLEEYYMGQVAQKEQEALLQKQQEDHYFTEYTDAVGQVLSKPDLNGIPLDNNAKKFIYENSFPQYQSQITGQRIDALQAVIEELKFGQQANPEFYAELMLHATNPQYYREVLMSQIRTELAQEKEKTLRKKVKEEVSGTNYETQQTNRQRPQSNNDKWF